MIPGQARLLLLACLGIFILRIGGASVTDNTVKTADGAILYLHDIYYYSDEYIEQELDGDKEGVTDVFVDMILYISDRIPKPSNDDIELLDNIFNIYIRLCSKYKVLPTLEVFSFLVNINRTTFTDWANGEYRNKLYYTMSGELIDNINTWRFNHKGQEYREVSSTAYSDTAKKWFNICKSFTVNRLHNKGGTDANLIFIAKAAYGMAETAPVQTAQVHQQVLTADQLPRLDGSGSAAALVEGDG